MGSVASRIGTLHDHARGLFPRRLDAGDAVGIVGEEFPGFPKRRWDFRARLAFQVDDATIVPCGLGVATHQRTVSDQMAFDG